MSKCGKGCMPECEYFTTGGCISPFNCPYKIETGYINSATSIPTYMEIKRLKAENADLHERLKQAEHRAEVAERALRKAVSVLDAEYRAFGVNRENKTEQRIKNFIEQAEKELAEVTK